MIDAGTLGRRIRGYRLVRGMSPGQLASAAGVKADTLASYETGKRMPGGQRLLAIMFALDISARDLVAEVQDQVIAAARPEKQP